MLLIGMLLAAQAVPNAGAETNSAHTLRVDMQFDAAFLAKADADKSGTLNLPEFTRAMEARMDTAIAANPAARKRIGAEQRAGMRGMIASMFRSLDVDTNGQLTLPELGAGSVSRAGAEQTNSGSR